MGHTGHHMNGIPMKRLLLALPLMFAGMPATAQMNPYQIGMQYCQMVNSGMSRKKAWDYSIQSYANTSPYGVNQGDPFAPWSPTRSFGGAIGSGIASGLAMGLQLRGMKGDIQKVINSNCPNSGSFGGQKSEDKINNPSLNRDLSHYCRWNPWEQGCKDGSINASQKETSNSECHRALRKYDCNYETYLEANPSMRDWAIANPVMAKKEAMRLKAIDAEKIGIEEVVSEPALDAKVQSKNDLEGKCLKAADYKGCMEYHDSN